MTTIRSYLRSLWRHDRLQPVRDSLRRRITVAVLGVASLMVAAVAFIAFQQNTNGLRDAIAQRLEGIANRRVEDVHRWITDELASLRFVAELPQVREDAAAVLGPGSSGNVARRRLGALLDAARLGRVGAVEMFVLTTHGGRAVAATDSTQVGTYHVSELYYERGLHGPFVQDIYPSSRTGRPALTIATPIKHPGSDTTIAVLVANLDLRNLEALLVQPTGPLPVEVYLVNRFAEFVSAERFGSAAFRRGVHTPGIDSALAGQNGKGSYHNYAGVAVIGAYRWMPERQLALIVESPEGIAFAPARRAVWTIAITGFIAIALLTLGIHWVTGRVVGPILAVKHAAEQVASGDLNAEAPVLTTDEVGVLATSFNAMTAHLRTLYTDLNDQVAATTRMVDALQKNRTLMQSIVDNSTAAIAVVGFSDQLLLVNRRLVELGRPESPVIVGKRIGDIMSVANAEAMRTACHQARTSKKAVELEVRLATGSGPRTLLVVCFPLFDDAGTPYAIGVIATDHTERRRAEEERRALEAQVRHSQKLESLGVMAGGIAHDFNNILGAVLGHAELALDALDHPVEARASLDQVVVATRRASDLTRQMLAYAGKASFGKDIIELNAVVRDISDLTVVSMSKKVRVGHDLAAEPTWVLVDGAQASQVILNLLTNAADAIGDRDGSITVTTSVNHWNAPSLAATFPGYHLAEGRYVAFSVQDTGSGMTAETVERIFDPFFTTKSSGRGLGLAAVLGIVRSSSGALAVDSVPNHGTTFTVIFPAQAAPARRTDGPDGPEPAIVERRLVLVADDEEMLRGIAGRALRKAGYDVVEAADGVEAWRLYQQHRRELSAIVLDMTMPGMSGQEVLAAIRNVDPEVAVVLSSGYDSQDSAATRAADPRVQFLQKPYAPRELVRRVAEVARSMSLAQGSGTVTTDVNPPAPPNLLAALPISHRP